MTDPAEPAQITAEALARWQIIPADTRLELSLTKTDLDNLLLGLRNIIIGQNQMVTAFSAHIAQDGDQAIEAMMSAGDLCRISFDKINTFISAVMAGATPAGKA